MNNNNVGICVGRLTRDVELRKSSNGNSFAFVNVACGRNYKNKEGEYETDFLSFSAFGKTAEFAEQHLHKGDVISIRYELRSSSKKGDDGKNITVINQVITGFEFIPGTKKNGSAPANATAPAPAAAPAAKDYEELDMEDDDLPF